MHEYSAGSIVYRIKNVNCNNKLNTFNQAA